MKRNLSRIYLDNASLTPVDKRVVAAMNDFLKKEATGEYANPSSIYSAGVATKNILEKARSTSADFFYAHADEIFFTGSGTEANNIALLGTIEKFIARGGVYKDAHIIVSAIEHASVLETARALEKKGVAVDIISVGQNGIVDLVALKKALKSSTLIVSIMMVNNEIGTIQPIQDIAKIVRDFKKSTSSVGATYPLVHTDACQALLYMDINLEKLGVDMLTADSHKMYGPRGVGMLYVRRSAQEYVSSIMYGGGQENGLRPGTENMPGIVGFAAAIEIAGKEKEKETARLTTLRDYCIKELQAKIPSMIIYGDLEQRIANNINVSIPHVDHEFLLLQLDVRGISCSTKSSCLRDEDESYVIKAISGSSHPAQSLRFSLGRQTSKKDIDRLMRSIDEALHS